MPEIPAYPALTAVTSDDVLVVLDVHDTSAASTGTVKKATVSALPVQIVIEPSGVTSGTTDAAAIAAAIAALPAAGGVVKLAPTAKWYVECGQVTATTGQYVDAAGCYISATGAGDLFRFVDSSNYNTRLSGTNIPGGAGLLGFPIIDGTSTTGNSCPFHGGDILQLCAFYRAQNFTAGTTSKGLWLDNNYYFTEQAYGRVYLQNCTAYAVIDNSANTSGDATNSFSRLNLDVYIAQLTDGTPQDGVVVQNGAFIYDGHLGIFGNVVTTSGAASTAVLRITGAGAGGSNPTTNYSGISNTELIIGVESDTADTNGPYTVYFGSSNNYIYECYGSLDFPFGNWTASNLPTTSAFVFTGPIEGDAVLAQFGWSFQGTVSVPAGLQLSQYETATSVTANAQTINVGAVTYIRLTSSAAYTGLILNNTGGLYGQLVVLVNEGNYPLSFDVPGTSFVAGGWVIQAGSQQTYIYSHFTGLWYPATPEPEQFVALTTTYTLSSTTALQKLFNATTNGALTVAASTSYFFECQFDLSSMSTVSGGFSFGFGGTATLTSIRYTAATQRSASVTTAASAFLAAGTAATAQQIASSTATGATGTACIKGVVRVNAAGTLIPELALSTAAAAVVAANSFFRCWPVGSNTVTNVGNWS